MFLVVEILKSFEKPINKEGFLRIVLRIETVLCSKAAQDCKTLIELAALIFPQRQLETCVLASLFSRHPLLTWDSYIIIVYSGLV